MDYTFVSQFSGDGPKRRRLAKACETCRTRKKRCIHFGPEMSSLPNGHHDEDSPHTDSSRNLSSGRQTSPAFSGDNRSPMHLEIGAPGSVKKSRRISQRRSSLSALMSSTAQRFISDLNPESRFLVRNPTDACYPRGKATDSIGVWVDRSEYADFIRQRDATNAGSSRETLSQTSSEPSANIPLKPTRLQISSLIDVYFQRFNSLLPLIEETEFRRGYAEGLVPEVLAYAMCLVAAKDKHAEAHVQHPDVSIRVSPREFCRNMYALVRSALATSPRYDKVTLIRLNALLSLHYDGPDGPEGASLCTSTAMHHCQTLGIHLSQQASRPAQDGRPMKTLFWCVWILDRFNAVTNGRPIVMADQDIAIESFSRGESGLPAFEMILKIAGLMNQVVSYYRPGNPPTSTGWEEAFPSFDQVVDECAAWQLPASVLSTLHVAYLATAILSHRSQGNRNVSHTASHVRQTLASIQAIRLLRVERLSSLHAFPFLPYTISLALSVSYQHLRQDQLQHQQEDGRADFEACYIILQEMRHTWASVDAMCTLGQKVLEELRRGPSAHRPTKDQRVLAGYATACRDNDEAVVAGQRNIDNEQESSARAPGEEGGDQPLLLPRAENDTATLLDTGQGLFEGYLDSLFDGYLDPNFPVNLEDLSFLDDFDHNDWAGPAMHL